MTKKKNNKHKAFINTVDRVIKKFSKSIKENSQVSCVKKYLKKWGKLLVTSLFFAGAVMHRIFKVSGVIALLNKGFNEVVKFKKSIFDDFQDVKISSENTESLRSNVFPALKFGFIAMGVGFLFFIIWGSLAPIDSATVAPGYIVSQSNNKIIQNQEGGVIERIMVADGQEVHKNEVLILLNNTAVKAKVSMIRSQLRNAIAIETRLQAEKEMMSHIVKQEKHKLKISLKDLKQEQAESTSEEASEQDDKVDNKEESDVNAPVLPIVSQLHFDNPLLNVDAPEVKKLIQTQNDLYQTNRRVIMSELSVFHQRISQRREDNKGLTHQLESLKSQLKLTEEDLKSLQSLSEKQLASKSRLLEVKRRVEEYKGSIGRIKHELSKNIEAITEDQSHITKTISDHFKEIYRELRDAQSQLLDLEEQYRAAKDVLERTEIKAPVDGYVTSLAFHTIGGVISPGAKIMEIVPKQDTLIVEARVSPRDIESIHVGLPTKIQLSAYKSKLVPRLSGKVIHVSADRIHDPYNHMQPYYYLAKVEIDQSELKNLNYNVKLIPGMPAEVFIVKGTRTMLQLLLSPLIDSFHKAFKEA